MSEPNRRSLVSGLFSAGRPLAIARFVVSVHVYAINLMIFRARTHVLKKRLKRVTPCVTHRNPASAVPLVRMMTWRVASLLCLSPRKPLSAACHAVLELLIESGLSPKAAAAFCVSLLKAHATDGHCVSAIAPTKPNQVRTSGVREPMRKADYREFPESLSGNIFCFLVRWTGRFPFSHAVHPFLMNGWLEPCQRLQRCAAR